MDDEQIQKLVEKEILEKDYPNKNKSTLSYLLGIMWFIVIYTANVLFIVPIYLFINPVEFSAFLILELYVTFVTGMYISVFTSPFIAYFTYKRMNPNKAVSSARDTA